MHVVGHDILQFRPRQIRLIIGEVKPGQLHLGPRVGVAGRHLLPHLERGIGLAERGQRFGQRHQRVTIIMFGIFGDHAFEQRARFGGAFLAEQALAKMGARVHVPRITFQRCAVAGPGFIQFALLKINVAELRVVVCLVEVIDLGLQFLDAAAAVRAGQFKSARGRWRGPINEEIIQHGGQSPAQDNKQRPNPFALADGVNQHPDLENGHRQPKRTGQKKVPARDVGEQRGEHDFEIRGAGKMRQSNFMAGDHAGAFGDLPPERGCVEDQPQPLRRASLLEYAWCRRAFQRAVPI